MALLIHTPACSTHHFKTPDTYHYTNIFSINKVHLYPKYSNYNIYIHIYFYTPSSVAPGLAQNHYKKIAIPKKIRPPFPWGFRTMLDGVHAGSEAEDTLKTGILYKKREVLPGWRPRTFIVDKRQRLLRYYLPSSAKPRGSIPLEGCSVGLTVASTDGRGGKCSVSPSDFSVIYGGHRPCRRRPRNQ